MRYITPAPNESGAYPAPQSTNAEGLVSIAEDLAAELLQYNGFVTLNIENGEVKSVTPNTEAREVWKKSLPPEPEKDATTDEIINILLGVDK